VEHKLEAIAVPVSDVDRARHFYRALGFRLDFDQADGAGHRVVRLTPPGSLCSILIGTDITSSVPGTTVAVLTVTDLDAAIAALQARGAAVNPAPDCRNGHPCALFGDTDGNRWLLVEAEPGS
jgi:catechol 2,3-dioxygenase-like lactoylglutathione lyase family enzyme